MARDQVRLPDDQRKTLLKALVLYAKGVDTYEKLRVYRVAYSLAERPLGRSREWDPHLSDDKILEALERCAG